MKWRPVDVVVLVLATAVGLAMMVTVIVPFFLGVAITDARSKFLAAIVQALVAVISVYVGSRLKDKE